MKILFLSKRQYMGRDLINDKYGRFREFSLQLAILGHDVQGYCLSYKKEKEGAFEDIDPASGKKTIWRSLNAGFKPFGFIKFAKKSIKDAQAFSPDIIIGVSDSPYIILAQWISKAIGRPYIADVYDHFETFSSAKIPGVIHHFKKAVKKADGLISFSNKFKNYMMTHYHPNGSCTIIENGFERDIFKPMDKKTCREKLGLPQDTILIGLTGALYKERGVNVLYEGFEILKEEFKNLHLVLAGPFNDSLKIPQGDRIHYLGLVSKEKVAMILNALDVAVISFSDVPSAHVSHPMKIHEIVACQAPFVATDIGAMSELMKSHKQYLFKADDTKSFITAMRRQIQDQQIIKISVKNWTELGKEFENFIKRIVEEYKTFKR